jgi:SAM-dependent methyltransferase
MIKDILSQSLRSTGLLPWVHHLQYRVEQWRNSRRNLHFSLQHPEIALPPDYLMFEAFGLDYRRYYEGGKVSTAWIKSLLEPHIDLSKGKILEWGCGPGRLIRHWQELLGPTCDIYGTDYNTQSIAWDRAQLPGIHFSENQLEPPLPFADGFFDAVYAISIFTHLSEAMHHAWWAELLRVTRAGGVILFTTHGDLFRARLRGRDLKCYDAGQLAVWGKVTEGHRNYSAFHPPVFVRELVKGSTVLTFLAGEERVGASRQDVWVLRKG